MAGAAVGVEIADSGTRLVVALSTERGARRWHARLPAPPTATEAVARIHELIARALAESNTAPEHAGRPDVSVGVALAGRVDAARGMVRDLPLAHGWQDFPLAAALTARWGGPAVIHTTTQAAALAEARLGAGRGRRELIYLVLGRGVMASFVLRGRVYYGAHGQTGDLGHWQANEHGPRCSCGALGHLEPIASAQSLVRNMIGKAVDRPESNAAMLHITGGRAEAMTAEQVVTLAARGDPAAGEVVGAALDALAPALANLVASLDPEAIVLGGPLASAGEAFLGPLRTRLETLCRPFTSPPVLLVGELEPAAALTGAVLSAELARAALAQMEQPPDLQVAPVECEP
jgi:glucokinase